MQFIKPLIVFYAIVCQCLAYQIKDANLKFSSRNTRGIMLGNINKSTKVSPEVIEIDNVSEVLQLGFSVTGSEKPSQASLLLGLPEKSLEIPIEPKVVENKELNFFNYKIDISEIPESILYYSKELEIPITASIILASEGSENLFVTLFKIQLTGRDPIDFVVPSRYGPQKEIHHIFHEEPKTAPWYICQPFILATIACTFFLIVSWMASGSLTFQNIPKGINFLYFIAFIGSTVGFEYIFLRYYSGSSIFDTLSSAAYLGLPAVWIGTKFLKSFTK